MRTSIFAPNACNACANTCTPKPIPRGIRAMGAGVAGVTSMTPGGVPEIGCFQDF